MDVRPKLLTASVLLALAEQRLGAAARFRLRLKVDPVGRLEVVVV